MSIRDLPLIMVRCLVCTIIIELIIALICGIRDKKDIVNVILVNIMTNPIVVSLPILILLFYGRTMYKIVFYSLEVITVIAEGFVYFKTLKYKKINPFLLSLILNIGSYFIGEVINKLL